MTKTFKLNYDHVINYETVIEAESLEQAKEIMQQEAIDFTDWNIVGAERTYRNIEEVN
jgi:hypothetical protein